MMVIWLRCYRCSGRGWVWSEVDRVHLCPRCFDIGYVWVWIDW